MLNEPGEVLGCSNQLNLGDQMKQTIPLCGHGPKQLLSAILMVKMVYGKHWIHQAAPNKVYLSGVILFFRFPSDKCPEPQAKLHTKLERLCFINERTNFKYQS